MRDNARRSQPPGSMLLVTKPVYRWLQDRSRPRTLASRPKASGTMSSVPDTRGRCGTAMPPTGPPGSTARSGPAGPVGERSYFKAQVVHGELDAFVHGTILLGTECLSTAGFSDLSDWPPDQSCLQSPPWAVPWRTRAIRLEISQRLALVPKSVLRYNGARTALLTR